MAIGWIRNCRSHNPVRHSRGDHNIITAGWRTVNTVFKVWCWLVVAELVGAVERDVAVPGAVEDYSVYHISLVFSCSKRKRKEGKEGH